VASAAYWLGRGQPIRGSALGTATTRSLVLADSRYL
jgi:hypothetical protein